MKAGIENRKGGTGIMKEVKTPKKPLLFYYGIVLAVIFVFNLLVYPMLLKAQVKEVDYGTFMKAIEEQKIDRVQVEDTRLYLPRKRTMSSIRPV